MRVPAGARPQSAIIDGVCRSSSDPELDVRYRRDEDWRDGRRSIIDSAVPNREYEISELSAERAARRTPHAVSQPLFEDATAQLGGHVHVDPYFDDYRRQPLLPNSFSQLGPGVAWYDYDGDGREDLIVGAGRTGSRALP